VLQQLLRCYSWPWWVCGGWAVDLQLGRQTREHKDIEIAILRRDLPQLREHFGAAQWEVVGRAAEGTGGGVGGLRPLAAGENPAANEHELYVELPAYGRLEVLLNEVEGGQWRYRRAERVGLPLNRLGCVSADGIAYLAPEVVLLYKSKGMREIDAQDFDALLPVLSAEQRAWLREALQTAHPGHAWIGRL
jgi:hypothetical protein